MPTPDCRVDFVPFHWYGYDINSNVDVFIKYVEDAYYYAGGDSGGRKIWITEVHLPYPLSHHVVLS